MLEHNWGHLGRTLGTSSTDLVGDEGAVVVSEGRPFGVINLWVLDASVTPLARPSHHPQATVYVLADKIADVIVKWK
jgi:choline dehydrogenase-like flavoprotein